MASEMRISEWLCGACACDGIQDLAMAGNPTSAMQTFVELALLGKRTRYTQPDEEFRPLATFYIFVAGPEAPGYIHSKTWQRYGTEFAKFITDNNLGPVVSPGVGDNRKHHSGSPCQAWVWMPHQASLIEWYKRQIKESV